MMLVCNILSTVCKNRYVLLCMEESGHQICGELRSLDWPATGGWQGLQKSNGS